MDNAARAPEGRKNAFNVTPSAPNLPVIRPLSRQFPCESACEGLFAPRAIRWIERRQLTEPVRDAAMRSLQCERVMSEIVDSILRTSGRSDLDAQSRAKVMRYLETLRSAGNRDEQQLTTFGLAYLEQLFNPDPRYSGC